MKALQLTCALFLLLATGATPAAPTSQSPEESDIEALERRIRQLEEEIEIVREQDSDFTSTFDDRMAISGYADVEYHYSSAAGAHPGFRLHHFSLFFRQQIAEQWRFFSEIEYEDAPLAYFDFSPTAPPSTCPACSGKIFVEAVNIDYSWDPAHSLRMGRFFTPAGIWSIDHYPPFVPTQQRPQHVRMIFPQIVDGALFHGTVRLRDKFLGYDLYLGNGEGNSGQQDLNSSTAVGAKIDLALPFGRSFNIGASFYQDAQNDQTDKSATGIHVRYQTGPVALQGEYAKSDHRPSGGNRYHKEGAYLQLIYGRGRWGYGGRYDDFDDNTAVSPSGNGTRDRCLFLNFRAVKDVVLKLEVHDLNPDNDDDYRTAIASVVVNLGN